MSYELFHLQLGLVSGLTCPASSWSPTQCLQLNTNSGSQVRLILNSREYFSESQNLNYYCEKPLSRDSYLRFQA